MNDADQSLALADRKRRIAEWVLVADAAMISAIESVMGIRGDGK